MKTLFAFALFLLLSPSAFALTMEETVASHDYQLADEHTAADCRRACETWLADQPKNALYKCAFDMHTRAFGRGDYRQAPKSCKLVRVSK